MDTRVLKFSTLIPLHPSLQLPVNEEGAEGERVRVRSGGVSRVPTIIFGGVVATGNIGPHEVTDRGWPNSRVLTIKSLDVSRVYFSKADERKISDCINRCKVGVEDKRGHCSSRLGLSEIPSLDGEP